MQRRISRKTTSRSRPLRLRMFWGRTIRARESKRGNPRKRPLIRLLTKRKIRLRAVALKSRMMGLSLRRFTLS